MLPNASGLTWIDPQHLLFSEIRQGRHMAIVTSMESRNAERDVWLPREKPAWLIVHRSRQTASGCWWSGWERGRLAVVPSSSLRRQLGREIGWTSGRGLHRGRMISGWVLDVFQFDCRGKIPYFCVTAGHRCVFLARNYDRAMRLRSDAREHRQQNQNSACVHCESPGANLRSIATSQGAYCSSYGERTRSMIALTRNLHLFGSCFLTGLTAEFVATLHQASAGSMRTLVFLICRHRFSPFVLRVFC
jgi:hypothetical protein